MTDLSRFRAGEATPQDTGIVFEEHDSILALDQSLASTGWVIMRSFETTPELLYTGMIRTDKQDTGHEGNLLRGVEQFTGVMDILVAFPNIEFVVHESPPVGGRMKRPESSLLAAQAVRIAGDLSQVPVKMVAAQRAKKVLTGNHNATKQEVRAAVQGLLPEIANYKPLNEHIFDAAALALVALMKEH